jgi:hypothetical protein
MAAPRSVTVGFTMLFVLLSLCVGALFLLPTECGAQWLQTNGPSGGTVNGFASTGSTLFAATSGGVFRSSDDGSSWSAAHAGFTNLFVLSIAANESYLVAGTPMASSVPPITAHTGPPPIPE